MNVLWLISHNFKHTYSQTEFGKRIFERLKERALQEKDEGMLLFVNDILAVYAQHKMK